jgi:DNA-binding NarL/FixJ family response regulator
VGWQPDDDHETAARHCHSPEQPSLAMHPIPLPPHTPAPLVRILIAAPHERFRTELQRWLLEEPDLALVGIVATRPAALVLGQWLRPDLLLLDLDLPGGDSLATLTAIKHQSPAIRVLVMTAQPRQQELCAARSAGADGALLKPMRQHDYLAAIRQIGRGELLGRGDLVIQPRHPLMIVPALATAPPA